jgi:hypothetical protein
MTESANTTLLSIFGEMPARLLFPAGMIKVQTNFFGDMTINVKDVSFLMNQKGSMGM